MPGVRKNRAWRRRNIERDHLAAALSEPKVRGFVSLGYYMPARRMGKSELARIYMGGIGSIEGFRLVETGKP